LLKNLNVVSAETVSKGELKYYVVSAPGAGVGLLVSSLDISDQAVSAGNANVGFTQVAGQVALCKIEEITDVSSQVRMRASAAG